ncbi:MAG TPA: diacylglycerol kinase family protein [Marmoricola sp.]|nr:diacylglycerol kinase family protein [Marmoricola sp.]
MIETPRQRWTVLSWALLCSVLFAVIAVLVAVDWQPLEDLDREAGQWPFQMTSDHQTLQTFWVWLGRLTDTVAMTSATVVAAVLLFVRNHRRAAAWLVVLMVLEFLTFTGLKLLIARERPVWDSPIQVLKTYSFPSGHATSISAAMGIAVVLTVMLVRRRGIRRLVIAVAVALAVLVAADRIFLGVHNLSDVTAGLLLGSGIVLWSLLLFDPRPRSIALANEPLPEALEATRTRTVAGILNPIKVDDPAGFRAMVDKMAEESGWEKVLWWETTVADTGYRMAHEAAVAGVDLALAIGGDGTIRAVCEELAGTGIPVGIVPAGTGNLLARNLDIPLYLRAAVDVGLNGQDRAIDMVSVSGDEMEDATFLVMAGMGFDAAIMEGVNEEVKKRIGWLAYVWSALKALMFPVIRVEISVDGSPFTTHRARTIVIGNVGHLQAGMPLIPDATIDDGHLDVVLLYPRRFLSWLPLAARVLTRDKRTDETITRMTGRRVVVRTSAAAPRQLDGDLIQPGKELVAECVHGRLLVRVPR